MTESILTSTKKILGLPEEYEVFDLDVMTHINSVFDTLTQLGVIPNEGFSVEDKAQLWKDLLGENYKLHSVKTYVFLRVKLLFDPPPNQYLLEAQERQIRELEWRLLVAAEPSIVVIPVGVDDENADPVIIFDGGSA